MNCKTKLLALTLASVMTASLAGCGASGSATSAEATSATQESAPGGEDGVFTIAYAPNESNTEAADARNGLADDLSAVRTTTPWP